MTTTRSLVGALALLVSAAPCSFGQDVKGRPAQKPVKAEMGMPRPAPEMAQVKFFDGSWSCEGTMSPSPFGPGGKMTSTVSSHAELGGFWQTGTVKGTSAGMPAFEGRFSMTWDAAAKRHMMLWVDNTGSWSQTTATGWDGDKIVFAGDSFMGGQKFATRDTFAKLAGGGMRHSSEMQADGKWVALGDETCRKGAAAAAKKK